LLKQLKRWNEKKEELKTEGEKRDDAEDDQVSFANYVGLSCLLCQRKFKTRADLGKHQDKSELHKVRFFAVFIHNQEGWRFFFIIIVVVWEMLKKNKFYITVHGKKYELLE
jgi:hypothetical protein